MPSLQINRRIRAPSALMAIRLVSLIAFFVSMYLAAVSFNVSSLAGCGGSQVVNCDDVLKTRWSLWLGIPVSVIGSVVYATIFGLSFAVSSGRSSREAFRTMCFVAGAASVWFLALQFLVIKQICLWCSAVQLCGLTIFGLMLLFTIVNNRRIKRRWTWIHVPAIYSTVGLLILVSGQLLLQPAEFEIIEIPDPGNQLVAKTNSIPGESPAGILIPAGHGIAQANGAVAPPEFVPPEHENDIPGYSTNARIGTAPFNAETVADHGKSRVVRIWRNAISLDIANYPVIGDPNADEVVVKMFDYSCPDCRRLHRQLNAFASVHLRPVVLVLVPVPMNSSCNVYIATNSPVHRDSCSYSRLALAVWLSDPGKFSSFHQWMMVGEKPPTVSATVDFIQQNLGISKVQELASSRDVSRSLARIVDLYGECDRGIVPKLFIRNKVIVGAPKIDLEMVTALQKIASTENDN